MSNPTALHFIKWALPHAQNRITGTYPIPLAEVASDPWGYIMGTSVIDCTEARVQSLRKNYPSWSADDYFAAARKWIGTKVTDCQGLADGFYRIVVGRNIDTTSKSAYANWCKTKGTDMAKMPKQIGVAVYMTGSNGKDSSIHHVGFICGFDAAGDPLVIEARGISYGVVVTKFKGRGWNRWGLMDEYFSYDTPVEKPQLLVAKCGGNDVKIRDARSTSGKVINSVYEGHAMLALPAIDGWCAVMTFIEDVPIWGYMYALYVINA